MGAPAATVAGVTTTGSDAAATMTFVAEAGPAWVNFALLLATEFVVWGRVELRRPRRARTWSLVAAGAVFVGFHKSAALVAAELVRALFVVALFEFASAACRARRNAASTLAWFVSASDAEDCAQTPRHRNSNRMRAVVFTVVSY